MSHVNYFWTDLWDAMLNSITFCLFSSSVSCSDSPASVSSTNCGTGRGLLFSLAGCLGERMFNSNNAHFYMSHQRKVQ